jgi:hypothetical protein
MILSCPHCRFSVRPRAAYLTMDYCPRCLAKRRIAEPLVVHEPASALAPAGARPERVPALLADRQGFA